MKLEVKGIFQEMKDFLKLLVFVFSLYFPVFKYELLFPRQQKVSIPKCTIKLIILNNGYHSIFTVIAEIGNFRGGKLGWKLSRK